MCSKGWLWNKVPHKEIRALRLGEIDKEPQRSGFRPRVSKGIEFIKKGRQACVGEPTHRQYNLPLSSGETCLSQINQNMTESL